MQTERQTHRHTDTELQPAVTTRAAKHACDMEVVDMNPRIKSGSFYLLRKVIFFNVVPKSKAFNPHPNLQSCSVMDKHCSAAAPLSSFKV